MWENVNGVDQRFVSAESNVHDQMPRLDPQSSYLGLQSDCSVR